VTKTAYPIWRGRKDAGSGRRSPCPSHPAVPSGACISEERAEIKQNWNPPPDSKDAKARVIFKINRSGWVITVRLDDDHSYGSFTFKQAAYRAISASNPFPSLPEEFFQPSLEFTVDLIPED
jgi:hypothetical protein